MTVQLQYYVSFGKGDSSDYIDWEIELTEEEIASLDELMQRDADSYTGGDVEAFKAFLESTFMDEEYYRFINTVALYYGKLFIRDFGANGEDLPEEEVYALAKQIYIELISRDTSKMYTTEFNPVKYSVDAAKRFVKYYKKHI